MRISIATYAGWFGYSSLEHFGSVEGKDHGLVGPKDVLLRSWKGDILHGPSFARSADYMASRSHISSSLVPTPTAYGVTYSSSCLLNKLICSLVYVITQMGLVEVRSFLGLFRWLWFFGLSGQNVTRGIFRKVPSRPLGIVARIISCFSMWSSR